MSADGDADAPRAASRQVKARTIGTAQILRLAAEAEEERRVEVKGEEGRLDVEPVQARQRRASRRDVRVHERGEPLRRSGQRAQAAAVAQ